MPDSADRRSKPPPFNPDPDLIELRSKRANRRIRRGLIPMRDLRDIEDAR